jgi:hypothetical protein
MSLQRAETSLPKDIASTAREEYFHAQERNSLRERLSGCIAFIVMVSNGWNEENPALINPEKLPIM